ncbi:MAG: M18 family aminopeptidase [Gemmiger sp.]|nr:M18 family aminopeptidase [Gemmiger sp.]
MDVLTPVFDFINAGVSPWHAAAHAARLLGEAGYTRLEDAAYWNLEPGHGYYTTRNNSAVVAWRVPTHALGGWRVTASHSDSPTWLIKNYKAERAGCTCLVTEGYGGMNMASWLDRPLSVAGRALCRTPNGVASRNVYLDRDLLIIPSLAIHMDRKVNEGHKYNPQLDMQPLYGAPGCPRLEALLAEELGCPAADILDADLLLTPRQKATRLGPEGEFFAAPRIDDLECAATTLLGFLEAAPQTDSACAPVWAMLDNEEVGSGTRQGAQSSFLRDTLDRIFDALPHSAQGQYRALANSVCLSADNAHATHPNFADKADPANPVRLNGGVVLKTNASQKYTTNALSGGLVRQLAAMAGVPLQRFANRADMPGGSTLGNLQSHTLPIPMADIGLAQLGMHAAVETAGTADAAAMVALTAQFYRCHLRALGDGVYDIE